MQSAYSSRKGQRHSRDSAAATRGQSSRRPPEWAPDGDVASGFPTSSSAGTSEDDGLRRDYSGGRGRGRGNGSFGSSRSHPPHRWRPPLTGPDDSQFPAPFPAGPRFHSSSGRPPLLPTPPWDDSRGGRPAVPFWMGLYQPRRFHHPCEQGGRGRGFPGRPSLHFPSSARHRTDWDAPCDDRDTAHEGWESADQRRSRRPLRGGRPAPADDRDAHASAEVTTATNAREEPPYGPVLHRHDDATAPMTSQNAFSPAEDGGSDLPGLGLTKELPSTESNYPVPNAKVPPKPRTGIDKEKQRHPNTRCSKKASREFRARTKISGADAERGTRFDSKGEKRISVRAETPGSRRKFMPSGEREKEGEPLRRVVSDAKEALGSRVTRTAATVAALPVNREAAVAQSTNIKPGTRKRIRGRMPERTAPTATTTTPVFNKSSFLRSTADVVVIEVEDSETTQCCEKDAMRTPLNTATDGVPARKAPRFDSLEKRTTNGGIPDSTTMGPRAAPRGVVRSLETFGIDVGDDTAPDNVILQQAACADKDSRVSSLGRGHGKRDVSASAPLSPPPQPERMTDVVSPRSNSLGDVLRGRPTYFCDMEDDRDIFIEPFFSEDYSCVEVDHAVGPDVNKASSSSRRGPSHSECRQGKELGTIRASLQSEASFGLPGYSLRPGIAPNPPYDMVPEDPKDHMSFRVAQWLNSCIPAACGQCALPETLQWDGGQQETARSASGLTFREGLPVPDSEVIVIDGDDVSTPLGPLPDWRGLCFEEQPFSAAAASRHSTSVPAERDVRRPRPDGTPLQPAAHASAAAPPVDREDILYELQAYSALRVLELCVDPERWQRAWELYTWGRLLDARERATAEFRRLAREAAEKRRVKWKGVTPALRKLANVHWTLSPTGRPEIKELRDLVAASKRGAEGGC